MFRTRNARTGIDIGSTGIKLVRGEGRTALESVSHAGTEAWDGLDREHRTERAGAALRELLRRQGLGRAQLGRVAVGVGWKEIALRETELPPITPAELTQALPFEARNHLELENMESPVLAGQVLGAATATAVLEAEPAAAGTRVLMAAVPRLRRDWVVAVLAQAGLEPEVVDLEPLAALNALFAELPPDAAVGEAVGLLDVGARHAALHIASRRGGLLTRTVGPDAPADPASPQEHGYRLKLSAGIEQTVTFYRGRYRQELATIHAAGGGALAEGRLAALAAATGKRFELFQPLAGLGARGEIDGRPVGPEYLMACGLCRWWDGAHV